MKIHKQALARYLKGGVRTLMVLVGLAALSTGLQASENCASRAFSSTEVSVMQAYIAYYGRPADPGGLAYWTDRLDEEGGNLSAIIEAFGTSEEYNSRFGSLDNAALVNNLYQQLFARDAEPDGLAFYVGTLESGEKTLPSIALEILFGAQNDDATTINHRLEAAEYYVTLAEQSTLSDASAETLSSLIAQVTATTDTLDASCTQIAQLFQETNASLRTLTATNTTHLGELIGYGKDMSLTDASSYLQSEAAGGDVVHGTDIGVPVTLNDKLYFFFGDTDPLDPAQFSSGQVAKAEGTLHDGFVANKGIIQGDAIAYSTDTDASDGVQLTHLLRNKEGDGTPVCSDADDDAIRPQMVPGVHDNADFHFIGGAEGSPCVGGASIITPTGAFAANGNLFMVNAVQNSFEKPEFADRSFLSVSTDEGKTWTLLNNQQPLSQSTAGPGGKFIHLSTFAADAANYQDTAALGSCTLPVQAGLSSTTGHFVFGTGTWLLTGVHLAWVYDEELANATADPGHPVQMYYYTGEDNACWSSSEADAVPVLDFTKAKNYTALESSCGNKVVEDSGGVGYTSITRLKGTVSTTSMDQLLMAVDAKYFACSAADHATNPCCGGTIDPDDSNICHIPDGSASSDLLDSSTGTLLVTGNPEKPWEWKQTSNGAIEFTPVPQVATASFAGATSNCAASTAKAGEGTLGGYAPLLLDRFTKVNDSQSGFDVYLIDSVWEPEHRYNVNTFKVTVSP